MSWWTGVQAGLALVLLLLGITVAVAGGVLLGSALATGGALWLWRCDKRI